MSTTQNTRDSILFEVKLSHIEYLISTYILRIFTLQPLDDCLDILSSDASRVDMVEMKEKDERRMKGS